jgi:hypothetical protein
VAAVQCVSRHVLWTAYCNLHCTVPPAAVEAAAAPKQTPWSWEKAGEKQGRIETATGGHRHHQLETHVPLQSPDPTSGAQSSMPSLPDMLHQVSLCRSSSQKRYGNWLACVPCRLDSRPLSIRPKSELETNADVLCCVLLTTGVVRQAFWARVAASAAV